MSGHTYIHTHIHTHTHTHTHTYIHTRQIDDRCHDVSTFAQKIDTIYKLYANYTEVLHFSAFIIVVTVVDPRVCVCT